MEKGIERGREETQREIALNLLKKGIEISDISEITGISEDEIKALQSKKIAKESMIQSFNLLIEQVAEKKGLKKGREEGLERGREENQREIALNLLKKGIEVSDISEITGISEDEIKALQSKKTS